MAKKTTGQITDEICERFTAQMIEKLEAGTVPWRKPWVGASSRPFNAVSKKPYNGWNVFVLAMAGYADPRWMTYKQAQQLGGQVRKGEKSTEIIFWKPMKGKEKDDGTKSKDWVMMRTYRVFNAEQVDGLPEKDAPVEFTHDQACEAAEALIDRWAPKLGGGFELGGGSAFYRPTHDMVQVPARKHFESIDEFYSTVFHEFAHSTGHRTRLAREGVVNVGAFGSHAYSREELIAELAAAFLCAMCGIENTWDNSAAYLAGWIKKLREDPRALIVAGGAATKAAQMIEGVDGGAEVR